MLRFYSWLEFSGTCTSMFPPLGKTSHKPNHNQQRTEDTFHTVEGLLKRLHKSCVTPIATIEKDKQQNSS